VDGELAAAVAILRDAFAAHPRRPVLDGCPHCRGSVRVEDHDLTSLSISLGNTVGGRDDVKALLPVLLERLLTSLRLDPGIVLGKLPQQEWRIWPAAERDAVQRYLDAVWRALLSRYPAEVGAFVDAATFLGAVAGTGESVSGFLDAWAATAGSAADRHLADLVLGTDFAARRPGPALAWLRGETVRARLLTAFERDHATPWADELARAYDLVRIA
jgi:hypothetical protein